MAAYYKGCPYCEQVFEIEARETDPLELHLRVDHGRSDSGARPPAPKRARGK